MNFELADVIAQWLSISPDSLWWTAFSQSFIILVAFAAAYIPLEKAWRLREQRIFRPQWSTDLLFFFGQYWLFGVVAFFILNGAKSHLAFFSLSSVATGLPLTLKAVIVIILGDFCVYWAHRAQHHFDFLWRFHAVHHTAEHLDWLAAHREHPLDGIYTQFAVNLPAMLLGFGLGEVLWLVTLRGMWSIFIHSNTKIPLGPLKYIMGSPQFHHWHHAKDRFAANYGNLSPWLDIIFGTHACPPQPPQEMGIIEPAPKNYLGRLVWPLLPRALWNKVRRFDGQRAKKSPLSSIVKKAG